VTFAYVDGCAGREISEEEARQSLSIFFYEISSFVHCFSVSCVVECDCLLVLVYYVDDSVVSDS